MDLPNPEQAGLEQSSAEFIDLAAMPPIRQRVSPADLAMGRDQAAAYVAGQLPAPGVEGPPPPLPPVPLPPTAPQQPAPPVATTAIPNPTGPDIRPADSDSIRRRIGRLYGQWKSEQERAADLEARLQRTEAALNAIQAPPRPFTNQFAQFPPQAPAPATPGVPSESSPGTPSDYVSRTELLAALRAHSEMIAEQTRTASAQSLARREAEADFPDVFADPDLKEAAERIYASDPFLRSDPNGPYKAAAMARGLRDPGAPAGGPAPTAERKAQLAGIGISIPQGTQQPNERELRFRQALAYANRTGRLTDYARARRIQMGAE